ncbi:hypothetical protein BO70DRAFT_351296 [Aspergillus heteromorphus CBS 117.55]|uniref:Uncharacterized protein n=1 Tax=Aspergillus heteromorphus CBS 117.55 TaxID=1448321 RepID=A0A317WLY8_9EURO|nr:uncharacterized protein BO70DRAFT_351296 [Aspergillus heteromorphus CBS 117.55]PWY86701.1 hypothetical protein BO70DRAFT_351296 [Aspergillus heteromorphus CBS 117.55]
MSGQPLPIVIPQQRPGSKGRGFIAAYAPSLESSGIDQWTFLQFLHDTNTALQGNKWLLGVSVVSGVASFSPEVISMAVATAIQVAATAANKAHIKYKTNATIDRYNEELFGPAGLYCMIMKYDPQDQEDRRLRSAESPVKQLGAFASRFQDSRTSSLRGSLSTLKSLSSRGSESSQPSRNPLIKLGSKFQDPVSGQVQGSSSLPAEVAPLIYIDDRREFKEMLRQATTVESVPVGDEAAKRKKSKPMVAKAAIDDYLDRRARARYTTENEGDILNVPLTRGFENRYLDPNHPAVNGGLVGFLSGGHIQRDKGFMVRSALRQVEKDENEIRDRYYRELDDIERQNLPEHEIERQRQECDRRYARPLQEYQGKRRALEQGERSIKKDILYLTIVNRPSDAELAAASERLSRGDYAGVNPVVGADM